MILSVLTDPNGEQGFFTLPVEQLCYVRSSNKKMVTLHTPTQTYHAHGTLEFWATALKASGFNFEFVDRTNIIHLSKVKRLDNFRRAYFTDDEKEVSECTVSVANVEFVKAYIEHNLALKMAQ